MVYEHVKRYIVVQFFLDSLILAASWLGAFNFRFYILMDHTNLPSNVYILTPVVVLISILLLTYNRVYHSQSYLAWHKEYSMILLSQIESVAVLVLIIYNIQPTRLSRLTLLLFLILSILFLTMGHLISRKILYALRDKGKNLFRILLVGHGQNLNEYTNQVVSHPNTGIQFCGWYDPPQNKPFEVETMQGEFSHLLKNLRPNAIVISYPEEDVKKQEEILRQYHDHFIPIIVIPNFSYSMVGSSLEEFYGIPLLKINQPNFDVLSMTLKRTIDITGSLLGLILLSPLFLSLIVINKITSPGPAFYGQMRMTRGGRIFKMWKFRSMRVDAEKHSGPQWTVEDDPRRTRFGTFLRKTSLDELPQLWNVFRGEMSIVGPRPERPELIEKFQDEIPGYMLRHKMKAGITGWAQVNGWRGNTSLHKRIAFDLYYIRNWNILLDIKILLLTVIRGFINDNAY